MAFFGLHKSVNVSAELKEEISSIPLEVMGTLPHWLSGTLVRNGPINFKVNGEGNQHWFDGLAMLHSFTFQEGQVVYTNKFLRSDAYRTVFEEGSAHYDGFASDPCRSLFKRFFTFFFSSGELPIQNANVNVAKMADAYVALTEVPLPVKFDPKTLATLGILNYQDALPHNKCWESAHPHTSYQEKVTLNYLIHFGQHSTYMLYSIIEGMAERKVIAEIPVEKPAYMHSFAVTEHYVVFTEFPFVVDPFSLITNKKAFIKHFTWQPELGTRFTVVDRQGGHLVGQYKTKPFFAFHHANAFEKDGMLHLDIVTYPDSHVVTGKEFQVDAGDVSEEDPRSRLERFSLNIENGVIKEQVLLEDPCEFPRINEAFDGGDYLYLYLIGFSDHPTDKDDGLEGSSLCKLNTETKEVLRWSEKGCSVGEPVFVSGAAIGSKSQDEDEGVVMAVVLDRLHQSSFLLILDGKTFKEIARATAPHIIPAGLHGQYFK